MPAKLAKHKAESPAKTPLRRRKITKAAPPWTPVNVPPRTDDGRWQGLYLSTDPLVEVTMDRGTFMFLWDRVHLNLLRATSSTNILSKEHVDVIIRCAKQFDEAATLAFGEEFKPVKLGPKKKKIRR